MKQFDQQRKFTKDANGQMYSLYIIFLAVSLPPVSCIASVDSVAPKRTVFLCFTGERLGCFPSPLDEDELADRATSTGELPNVFNTEARTLWKLALPNHQERTHSQI